MVVNFSDMQLQYTSYFRLAQVLFGLLIVSIGFSQVDELKKEIEKIILHDTEIELEKTPGFVIGVIDQDSTFFLDFGTAEKSMSRRLDKHSIFEIGSCTKVFTAALVDVLIQNGLLQQNTKVNDLIDPNFINPRLSDLTIEDLIMHTSGLPKRPQFFGKKEKSPKDPYANYSKNDLLKFYSEYVPDKKYKAGYRYAHTNYALIELVLEEKFEKEFEHILRIHLFDPLEMNRTFMSWSEERLTTITPGYGRNEQKSSPWSFKSFGASEGLKSNLEELCFFVRANMGISFTPMDQQLSNMLHPKIKTKYNKKIKAAKGWHIVDHGSKYNIVMHSGTTSGHKAIMAFIKETQTGVVLLSNSSLGTEDLGILILRMINHNWKRKAS